MLKLCLFLLFSANLYAEFHVRFEPSEHAMAGDDVILSGGLTAKKLHLSPGFELSFGDLVAMPDFYGVVGSPISLGKDAAEREELFLAAFESIEPQEAAQILTTIHAEHKLVLEGMERGQLPKDIYGPMHEQQNILWNCLTGGACSGFAWWLTPGRYLLLAEKDYDHFGDHALITYMTGHRLALATAKAGELERAYMIEAFAEHFLTDRFSSGHLRAPRVEMPEHVTPGVVGSLLVSFMHDEESAYGLHVYNQLGDHWIAYGDQYYLDPRNQDNRVIMQKAMQLSVDEVSDAYFKRQDQFSHPQLDLIPIPSTLGNDLGQDIAPMFYWDSQNEQLMRRENLADPYDFHWTSDWYGWSTLALLKTLK